MIVPAAKAPRFRLWNGRLETWWWSGGLYTLPMNSLSSSLRTVSLAALLLLGLACGKAEIGESCDDSGSQEECVENAVCDTEGAGSFCLKVCQDDTQCDAATEACTGVSGSNLKACHKK